jgi:pyrroloquinoline quinone biosynthesis protein D
LSARLTVTESSELAFERGVRLHFDQTRSAWTLMAPEKVVVLDEIAHEVVSEALTGEVSVGQAIDALARKFQAPREEISGDVMEMLQGFADKRLVRAR